MKRRTVILSSLAVFCAALLAALCFIGSKVISRDEKSLAEVTRSSYGLTEDTVLNYIGLVCKGNKAIVWYIGWKDETKIYYPVSYYALGPKKSVYFFDEAFDPIVGGAIAYQKWNGGMSYAITEANSCVIASGAFTTTRDVPFVGYSPSGLSTNTENDIAEGEGMIDLTK